MNKLKSILQKNYKLLLRNPLSSLIIVLGPLLLVILLGFTFSNANGVLLSASTYSPEYSALAQSTLDVLSNQGTLIVKQDTLEECIKKVQTGTAQICIEFPQGFSADSNSQIIFHTDHSQINLVWAVLDNIQKSVQGKNTELSLAYSQDVLERLNFAKAQIESVSSQITLAKSDSASAKLDIDDSIANVQSINVDLGVDIDGIIDANSQLNTANTATESLYSTIETDLDLLEGELLSIQEDLKDILEDANGTGLEDELEEFNETIGEILEDMTFLKSSAGEDYTAASERLIGAQTLLSDMSTSVDELDTKLASAASAKTTTQTSLENAQITLESLQESITTIESVISATQTKISGVSFSATQLNSPIQTKITPINNSTDNFSNMFPVLLTIIVMFTSILLGATFTFTEKTSRAHLRNLLTPTKPLIFNLGTLLSTLSIVAIQIVLFISISAAIFKVGITPHLYVVLITAIAIGATFAIMGMILGYLFKTQETTILGAITFALLMVFFSNTIVPIATMPAIMQLIARYSPFVLAENVIRQITIFGLNILDVYIPAAIVLVYVVAFYLLFTLIQKNASKISFVRLDRKRIGLSGKIGLASKKSDKVEVKKELVNSTVEKVIPPPKKELPPAPKPSKPEHSSLPEAPAPVIKTVVPTVNATTFVKKDIPEPVNDIATSTFDERKEVAKDETVSDFEARLSEINRILGE